MCKYELPIHQGFRKLSSETDRQTDVVDRNYKSRRFAGGHVT